MAWENRKGRRYYYKKRRVEGRVVSDYVGAGPYAELVAALDAVAGPLAAWKRTGVAAFEADFDAASHALDGYEGAVDRRVALVLVALGFHRRKREWRRARTFPALTAACDAPRDTRTDMTTSTTGAAIQASLKENDALLKAALADAEVLKGQVERALERGDHERYNAHLEELRATLRDHPTAWQATEDLALDAARTLAGVVTRGDPDERRAFVLGLGRFRDDLGYGEAPPLERLLVDRVALAWLACAATERCYLALGFRGGAEPEHGAYWERRMASAERRLARAVEALARTRKLLRSTKAVQAAYAALSGAPNALLPDPLAPLAAGASAEVGATESEEPAGNAGSAEATGPGGDAGEAGSEAEESEEVPWWKTWDCLDVPPGGREDDADAPCALDGTRSAGRAGGSDHRHRGRGQLWARGSGVSLAERRRVGHAVTV